MKNKIELITQNIFSVFLENDIVSEVPEFLAYLAQHARELKPSAVVSVFFSLFEDRDQKNIIKKHIKDDLGIDEVIFENKSEYKNPTDMSISGVLPSLGGHKNTRLERTAYEFFCALVSGGYLKDLEIIIKSLEHLYKNYLDEVQVTVVTDTMYGPELEKAIGNFCAKNVKAKHAVVKQIIDKNNKGGVKIKWRDFVCDATYLEVLKGF